MMIDSLAGGVALLWQTEAHAERQGRAAKWTDEACYLRPRPDDRRPAVPSCLADNADLEVASVLRLPRVCDSVDPWAGAPPGALPSWRRPRKQRTEVKSSALKADPKLSLPAVVVPAPKAPASLTGAQRTCRVARMVDLANIDLICRSSFHAATAEMVEDEALMAARRRELDLAGKRAARKKAAAWRRGAEMRKQADGMREEERRKAEQENQRLAAEENASRSRKPEEFSTLIAKMKDRRSTRLGRAAASVAVMTAAKPDADSGDEEDQLCEKNADIRINLMRKAHKLKKKVARLTAQREVRTKKFHALPDEERAPFEKAFLLHHQGDGILQANEIRDALAELGIRGVSALERETVAAVCAAQASAKRHLNSDGEWLIGTTLPEFVMEVVPAVRAQIVFLYAETLGEQFVACDRDVRGDIDLDQLEQGVRRVVPVLWDDRGGQVQVDALGVLKALLKAHSSSSDAEDEAVTRLAQAVQGLAEDVHRAVAERQRKIREEQSLEEMLFRDFRPDVITLYKLFSHADADANGSLDSVETSRLVEELGLMPKVPELRKQVGDILKDAQADTFQSFVELLGNVRKYLESQRFGPLAIAFKRHAGASGYVSATVLPALLEEVGVYPRDTLEKESFLQIVQNADQNGTNMFSCQEALRVSQRTRELIRQQRLLRELDFARKHNFSEEELKAIRGIFDALDNDCSDRLDKVEVWQAMKQINASNNLPTVQASHFEAAFRSLDDDKSGDLEFVEFLRLLQMARDREGVFKDHSITEVSTLAALERVDLVLLLECFDVSTGEAETLDSAALLHKAAELMQVNALKPLLEQLQVETYKDLYTHARWQYEFRGSSNTFSKRLGVA